MDICELDPPKGTPVGSPELEIGRLQGAHQALQDRVGRHEERFEEFVRTMDERHARMDSKLDTLISQQHVAAAVREDVESRSDRRAKKIAGWTATIAGIVIVIIGELARWYFRAYWGG